MKRITLREARERAGMTQQQLADASGVPQSVISRIESGVTANPGISIVLRLARRLRLSADQLRFGPERVAS